MVGDHFGHWSGRMLPGCGMVAEWFSDVAWTREPHHHIVWSFQRWVKAKQALRESQNPAPPCEKVKFRTFTGK
eukprot:6456317-Amphidinium_carterae.1